MKTRIFVKTNTDDNWHVFEEESGISQREMIILARASSSLVTTRCGQTLTGRVVDTSTDPQEPLCASCKKYLRLKKKDTDE